MANNLQAASRRAIQESRLSQLDNIGQSRENFEVGNLTVIETVLGEFIQRVQSNIQNEGLNSTGQISELTIEVKDNKVNVMGKPWLLYQDRGVSGINQRYNTPHAYTDRMPPMDVFKEWIKTKNIQLRNNATYHGPESPFKELTEEEQQEKAAWAISQSIYRKGLKPKNIYSKEIPKLVDDLKQQLANFGIQQIQQQMNINNRGADRVIINM